MRIRTLAPILLMLALAGCSDYRMTADDAPPPAPAPGNPAAAGYRYGPAAMPAIQDDGVRYTVQRFLERDPSLQRFFSTAYGYAVLPEITKGAIGLGGAHGTGVVYEQGQPVGLTSMTQGTLGVQLGGQVYSEVIFFRNRPVLDGFKDGSFTLNAQASAVAAAAGAAADADYEAGVAVFTLPRTGLMFEAAVGGQGFSYKPLGTRPMAAPNRVNEPPSPW